MLFIKKFTIFNVKRNPDTKLDEYKRTVVSDVHYENETGVQLGDKSLKTDNSTVIVFPLMNEQYLDYLSPEEYKNATSVIDKWTVQKNDIVVLGEYTEDIENISNLKGVDNVRTVDSYDLIDYAMIESLNNLTITLK